jgi:hypothetical protein
MGLPLDEIKIYIYSLRQLQIIQRIFTYNNILPKQVFLKRFKQITYKTNHTQVALIVVIYIAIFQCGGDKNCNLLGVVAVVGSSVTVVVFSVTVVGFSVVLGVLVKHPCC